MVLSDRTIKEEIAAGRIVVEPLGENAIQPASVDVHLDKTFLVFRNSARLLGTPRAALVIRWGVRRVASAGPAG